MIVPDKQMRDYLNEPLSAAKIQGLCLSGVLSAEDYLRAIALARLDRKWAKFALLILRFLMLVCLGTAAFFFVVAKWDFFHTQNGFVLCAALFALCAVSRKRFAVADYAGAVLIGFMTVLPDIVYATNTLPDEALFLFFVLSVFWAATSKSNVIRLLPFVLFNALAVLYGLNNLLPPTSGQPLFFIAVALLDFTCLAGIEALRSRFAVPTAPCYRQTALAAGLLFVIAAAVWQSVTGASLAAGDSVFVAGPVCVFAVLKAYSDKAVRLPVALFAVCWTELFLYRATIIFGVSGELRTAALSAAACALIAGATIYGKRGSDER